MDADGLECCNGSSHAKALSWYPGVRVQNIGMTP